MTMDCTTTAAYSLDGDAAKAHATINLDRVTGLQTVM